MAIIFDGKSYARKVEDQLYHRIEKLGEKPVMATVIVGEDPASRLYVKLKREAAERIGAEMDVYEFPETVSLKELLRRIDHLNADKTVSGIMVQLPLPKRLKKETDHILAHISPEKDVDGLRENSPFVPATVRAVLSILDQAKTRVSISPDAYTVVVGAKGEVGSRLIGELSKLGYEVGGITHQMKEEDIIKETSSARVVVSATGDSGIIGKEYIGKGAIVIDVGSPKGDVNFNEVREIAGFITPVPGGVGPVTVVSLMGNLVDAVEK